MEDLTTGPLTRHLLKTTSFMLVMMIFQTLYFLIDLYWVGRLGTHAGSFGRFEVEAVSDRDSRIQVVMLSAASSERRTGAFLTLQ